MTTLPKFVAMADVLGELGVEIEALGEVLCRDPTFAAQHLRELQAIDLIAQKQRALAALLASGFCEMEMRKITIDTLRHRFCGFLEEGTTTCPLEFDDDGDGEFVAFWEED
ncbi:hypothetical protein [Novosphingobium album (ex Liu et al. 2023)]|uniref:Uncharacterized protein n=1 Tax=Novosphingobium album (ex Liu et al. 2023) TaxID=3031130 RepID=A0ABT5WWZ8_9SPHN|nr:hypothetical protein [Novosphingobium album (ex Liu et al. 2023)]MDE8654423.1 hypothetical protein [Novosphingobium album (ex Liu et al. 2023)]